MNRIICVLLIFIMLSSISYVGLTNANAIPIEDNDAYCVERIYEDWHYLNSTTDGLVLMLNFENSDEGIASLQCMSANTGQFIWDDEIEINCLTRITYVRSIFDSYIIGKRIVIVPYLTHHSPYKQTSFMYCIDILTGDVVWEADIMDYQDVLIYTGEIDDSCYIDGYLYLLSSTDKCIVHKFKADEESCEYVCLYDVCAITPREIRLVDNVVVSEDHSSMILFGEYVACFDISDPVNITKLWDNKEYMMFVYESEPISSSALIKDDKAIIVSSDSVNESYSMFCISLETGEMVWKNEINMCIYDMPYSYFTVCERNVIYFNSFFYINSNSNTPVMKAFDIDTGELSWSSTLNEFNQKLEMSVDTRYFKMVDDNIYIVGLSEVDESTFNIVLYKINGITGEAYWREIIPTEKHLEDLYKWSLIINIDNGRIYLDKSRETLHKSIPFQECSMSVRYLRFTIDKNELFDDGNTSTIDSAPVIDNNRTLHPARYVVEPLGGQVFWDGEQRKVTCKLVAPDNADTEEYKENIVELWIDKPTARVNGVEVQIDPDNPDVVPTIINDRTMVPMRFLAESLGCEVEWVADTKEIILTYSP